MRLPKKNIHWLLCCLILTTALAGCSSSAKKDALPETLGETELYQMANKSLDTRNYPQAIERLQAIESRYPFGEYAERAQLDLIYANYMNVEPEAARAAADRFIRLHPQHPNVDYAYYMKGLAANTASMGIIERYLPLDSTSRDPGQAVQSFAEFRELITRFPDSPYANDAKQRMIALRNRLAAYELHAADYYLKRKAYVAAINRSQYIIENMQTTSSVEPALGIIIEGYQYLGLEEPAAEALAVLKLNYPESGLLGKEGQFVGYRYYDDVNPSLLYTITFGLVGSPGTREKPQAPIPELDPVSPPEPPPEPASSDAK